MSTSTTRTCPNCRTALTPDNRFCPSCGTSTGGTLVGGTASIASPAAAPEDKLVAVLQAATLGHYDIYCELGRGGMAAVYLALDLKLNRKVAIKTMLPDLVQREGMVARFRREAQTSAALSHPHIVQIFSVEETDELVFFVMKYIEGRSLESIMAERGQLDVDLTRVVITQAGQALAFAHRKNVVHRDVKPANIMLEEDGWAIVTDFGIAKVQEAANLTATGTAIGTPHYMSPEQFHNKSVTGQSDQYSLGIVAYEMLTGKKPFDGETYPEIITQHLFDVPVDLRELRPDVPANVAETIMRMMSKSADDRFPDLDAAVSALGVPTKTQGDAARTQLMTFAKMDTAVRQARMSVPVSPVPVSRTRPNAKTASATAQAEMVPEPAPVEKKSSKAWMYAAAAVVVLGGGGAAAFFAINKQVVLPPKPVATQQQVASTVQAGTPLAGAPAAAGAVTPGAVAPGAVGSPPAAGAAVVATPAKTAPKKLTKAQRADSIAAAKKDKKKAATEARTASKTPDAPVTPPITGSVKVGSYTDQAHLIINGEDVGLLKGIKTKEVSAKKGVVVLKIIAGDKCTPFDTTFTIGEGQTAIIGRHDLTCQ